jgi:uncharacterized protein (TIGR02246 family)
MKKPLICIYFLFISSLLSVNTFAQIRSYSKTDLSALQELPEKWIKFWNIHNIDSLSTLLQKDVDVVTVPGTFLKGRVSFIKDHSARFSTIFRESVLTRDTVMIKYVKPDLAIIHFGWGISGDLDRQGNKQELRHGIGTWVAVKKTNTWKILFSHMMLKLSPPSGK